jgi:hypothetical protein
LQRVLDKATGYVYVERKGEESKSNSNIQPNSQPLRDVPLPLDDDSAMAAYEPRDATKRGTAASAASLFTVADRGAPMGWGSAADVQERWVDNREDWEHFEIKERTDLEARWEKSAEPGPSQDSSGKASTGSVQERMAPTTTL